MSLRISLKWFLLTCVALVIPVAYVVRPWVERLFPDDREQREVRRIAAIARLTELGAVVRGDGNRVVEVEIPPQADPAKFTVIADVTGLERLRFAGHADDKLIRAMAGLTELRELHLNGPGITNDAMQTIGKLRRLKSLSLTGTRIDDQGLAQLRELHYLYALDLESTPIRGPGLVHLMNLTGLETLDLARTNIDDESLISLGGLTHLRELDLSETGVQGAGLGHLAGCRRLRMLSLGNLNMTDLSSMAELDQIEKLRFYRTRIPPLEMRHLADMERLLTVELHGSMFTDQHLSALAAANQIRVIEVWNVKLSHVGVAAACSMAGLEELKYYGSIQDDDARRLSAAYPKLNIGGRYRPRGHVLRHP